MTVAMQIAVPVFLQTEYRHAVCLATVCSLPAALQGENSQSATRKGAKLMVFSSRHVDDAPRQFAEVGKWPNPREISGMLMARLGKTVAGGMN